MKEPESSLFNFEVFENDIFVITISDLLYLPVSLPCFAIFVIFAVIVIFGMFICTVVTFVILGIAYISGHKWFLEGGPVC